MICKNPGGGYTPPPNFTQGGVMDCHPPLKPPMARILKVRKMKRIIIIPLSWVQLEIHLNYCG